jgi:hypothetical protein
VQILALVAAGRRQLVELRLPVLRTLVRMLVLRTLPGLRMPGLRILAEVRTVAELRMLELRTVVAAVVVGAAAVVACVCDSRQPRGPTKSALPSLLPTARPWPT